MGGSGGARGPVGRWLDAIVWAVALALVGGALWLGWWGLRAAGSAVDDLLAERPRSSAPATPRDWRLDSVAVGWGNSLYSDMTDAVVVEVPGITTIRDVARGAFEFAELAEHKRLASRLVVTLGAPPEHGTVRLEGTTIVYVPDGGRFDDVGADVVAFSVQLQGLPEVVSYELELTWEPSPGERFRRWKCATEGVCGVPGPTPSPRVIR